MKAIFRSGFLALAIMVLAVPANAGPFEDGLVAYQRGDYATALKFWRPLAEQGDAGAQNNVGNAYLEGLGVPQDFTEAAKWLHKAAAQGVANARTNLGLMYANGQGVTQDRAEAAKWWRKAAEQFHAEAQLYLGISYYTGLGVPKGSVLAYMWFNLAAAQGLETAQQGQELVAKGMTPAQIAEAQRMAREWLTKHQQ